MVAFGSLADAGGASLGVHLVLLAFLGLRGSRHDAPLVEVDLVEDPAPDETRVTPPAATLPEEPLRAIEEAPVPESPPEVVERPSLAFLRSDGLADAPHVDSAFVSDRDARAILEGRSRADVAVAPLASAPGPLPSPEGGMGPTHSASQALRIPKQGVEDRGEDRPPPGAPAPTLGAPREGALQTAGAKPLTEAAEAIDAVAAVVRRELVGKTEPTRGDAAAGNGADSTIAAAREAKDARAAEERNDADGTTFALDRFREGQALADASTVGVTRDRDAPEGGGADGDGRTGADSERSPARDGAPGRQTLPGQLGAPSQLQAAPSELEIDLAAMLSVRGHPLGPWLVLLDVALRERWHPPADLRLLEGTAVVTFRVSRQGRVTEIQLQRGSGRSALDALAIASIPAKVPPPSGFMGEGLIVRYGFRTGP